MLQYNVKESKTDINTRITNQEVKYIPIKTIQLKTKGQQHQQKL